MSPGSAVPLCRPFPHFPQSGTNKELPYRAQAPARACLCCGRGPRRKPSPLLSSPLLSCPLLFSPLSSPSLFSPPHLSPPLLSRVSWSKCSSTELCPAQPRNPASKHPLGHQVPVPCRRSRASCFLWPSCLVFSSSKCGRWHSHRPRWDSAVSSSECPPCPSHTASNFWAEFLRKQQV